MTKLEMKKRSLKTAEKLLAIETLKISKCIYRFSKGYKLSKNPDVEVPGYMTYEIFEDNIRFIGGLLVWEKIRENKVIKLKREIAEIINGVKKDIPEQICCKTSTSKKSKKTKEINKFFWE